MDLSKGSTWLYGVCCVVIRGEVRGMTRCLDIPSIPSMADYFDIHTHHPGGDGFRIVNRSPADFVPCPGQWYSVGIHPWALQQGEVRQEDWENLREAANHPQTLAIGEAGLDKLVQVPMEMQEAVFVRQAEMAEEVGKPLIIHLVKATDGLLRLRKRLAPQVPWIIHGFRGKAQLAGELLRHGFYLSFGVKFQEEALRAVPLSRLFIETDESPTSVAEVYERVAVARQISCINLCEVVRINVQSVFFH